MAETVYRIGNDVDLDEVIDLYSATTLGPRRPLQDRARVAAMLRNANLVITAWDGDLLVGIARSLTDHSFVTYLSDLAVRESHQQRGIGRELIRRTREASGGIQVVLLSAPQAVGFYPRIGFGRHDSAWVLPSGTPLL